MILIFSLLLVIFALILGTTRFRIHPFLSLVMAALCMGFLGGLSGEQVIQGMSDGFGATVRSIGLLIAFGTIIGVYLDKSGAAKNIANYILRRIGEKNAPLALNLTGFFVSIPVFCDSGFIVLAPVIKALARKQGASLVVLAVALSTGLYATHVFVPPTPGPLAAAAALGADIGLVLLLGILVAVPVALVGMQWAKFSGKRLTVIKSDISEMLNKDEKVFAGWRAFAPILLPIILIAVGSIADYPSMPLGDRGLYQLWSFLGDPVSALLAGAFVAMSLKQGSKDGSHSDWVRTGLKNAGVIILITAAGGAFGNVLRMTGIGTIVGEVIGDWHGGLLFPFLIAALLKSAQGSSTVSIITTAALVAPLLEPLGMSEPLGRVLAVLAIGAGAMTVSHVNDSYFWVVSQFSDMDTATALRSHTIATLLQGLTGIMVVMCLAWILI